MPRNKPSLTARKVARDFLFVVEDLEVAKLAPAGSVAATYEVLEAAGMLKPWMVSLIKAPWYQRFGRATGSRVLVTYIHQGGISRDSLGWLGGALTFLLKLAGEPFKWGVAQDEIDSFLAAQGFRVFEAADRFDLEARYVEPAGHEDWTVARLERVVAAEIADSGSA